MNITIVIPAYNYAHFLREAIDSALAQTLPCNILVVNDGSTDNTKDVIAEYGDKILSVYKENTKSLAHARNFGVAHVPGETEYIITLDADDLLLPEYAEKTYKAILKNNADIVHVYGLAFEKSDDPGSIIDSRPFSDELYERNICLQCALIKKTFIEKVGGWDNDNHWGWEDWMFWVVSYKAHAKQFIVKEPLFRYRVHANSMTQKDLIPNMRTVNDYIREKGFLNR